jgi:hypothetical protein
VILRDRFGGSRGPRLGGRPALLAQARWPLAGSVLALTAPWSGATAQEVQSRDAGGEIIVVIAEKQRGGVAGAPQPIEVLDEAAIEAAGAVNLGELLATLTPQARSGRSRGGGPPAVLLNGRRIAGFNEIRLLPSEAIARVDVLPEEVAVRYGFAPDQRVINFVLKERFRSVTAEADLGALGSETRATREFEFGLLRITPSGRINLTLENSQADGVSEADRGIVDLTGLRDSAFRTLAPATSQWDLGLNANRTLGETGVTVDLRYSKTDTESLLGRTATGLLTQDALTTSGRAGLTVDGFRGDWQWSASVVHDRSDRSVITDETSGAHTSGLSAGAAARAQTDTRLWEAIANANGPLSELPAGPLRAGLRIGVEDRLVDARSERAGVVAASTLARSQVLARASLTVPITSRRNDFGAEFGEWSLTASAAHLLMSDFEGLTSYSAALTYSPVEDLRITVSRDRSQAAPTVEQLGDAQVATPAGAVFDPLRGESAIVTRLTGGNPLLTAESRTDWSLGVVWEVPSVDGLEVQATYAKFAAENALSPFPTLTPALEEAFPSRISRDALGRLVAIDRRPINIAARRTDQLRWGLSFARNIGKAPERGPGLGAGPGSGGRVGSGAGPGAATAGRSDGSLPSALPAAGPSTPAGPGGRPGGRPVPGGLGGARMGGGQFPGMAAGSGWMGGPPGSPSGAPGRWSVSLFHTWKFAETARLSAQGTELDLLDGDALREAGGTARHELELEGGWFYKGVGFRVSANWQGKSRVDGPTPASTLFYDDALTANLRLFMNFSANRTLVAAHPYLKGVRVFVRADNVTDSGQQVKDASGATPFAFQKGFQAPRGRVIEVSLRKQF